MKVIRFISLNTDINQSIYITNFNLIREKTKMDNPCFKKGQTNY